jgi:hypothetical protein
MLINCKVDSAYYQIYLASADSLLDLYDNQDANDYCSFGEDCIFVVTEWENIEREISVTFRSSPPTGNDYVLAGETKITSPSKIFELGVPDLPGCGIFFLSAQEELQIKIFNDGKELPTSVVFVIVNTELSGIKYEGSD